MMTLHQETQQSPQRLSEEEKSILRARCLLISEVEIQLIIHKIEQSIELILTFRQLLISSDNFWEWRAQSPKIETLVKRILLPGK